MQQCDGSGVCLTQTSDINTYEKYPDFVCNHECKPMPCPNVIVCESWLPKWLIGLKQNGLCLDCNSKFGKKLDVVENTECPLCMEIDICVIQPKCTHPTCVACFKRCMYGRPDSDPPTFPYTNDILDEYENDLEDDPKWGRDYPLIKKWQDEYNKWDNEKEMKYHREQNLRICPICRR